MTVDMKRASPIGDRGRRHRRVWLSRLVLPLALAVAGCSSSRHPSIVMVVVDALRADYLGAYGFQADSSPHLDRLAAESLVFTSCYSAAPWTKASVASLFTSQPPEVHGVTNHEGRYWGDDSEERRTGVLPPEALTLAEVLRGAGYRTGAFHGNPWMLEKYGFGQGFESYVYHPRTEGVIDAASAWLAGLKRGQPFFLYVHLMDVHAPYTARPEDFARLRRSRTMGDERTLTDAEYKAIPSYLDGYPLLDPAERRQLKAWRAKYAAAVRTMDDHVAGLLATLRRRGVFDRSLFVLTADHGEELLDHGGWDHGSSLHTEQLHVPLIVRRPRGGDGGRRVDTLVSLLDLMPTLLAATGTAAPAQAQGRRIPAVLGGGPAPESNELFASGVLQRPGLHTIRTSDHVLILDAGRDTASLFDLTLDPGERQDASTREPQVKSALRRRLLRHLALLAQRPLLPRETEVLPAAVREQLRALGYIQ